MSAAVSERNEEARKLPCALRGVVNLPVSDLLADPLNALRRVQRAFVQGELEVLRQELVEASSGGHGQQIGVFRREQQVIVVDHPEHTREGDHDLRDQLLHLVLG